MFIPVRLHVREEVIQLPREGVAPFAHEARTIVRRRSTRLEIAVAIVGHPDAHEAAMLVAATQHADA
jgi:hypothetical protein